MGRAGELMVILAIVFLLFGTRRLRSFGSDLGAAIGGFKKQMKEENVPEVEPPPAQERGVPAEHMIDTRTVNVQG